MLHPLTSEAKQPSDPARTAQELKHERTLHPRLGTSLTGAWAAATGSGLPLGPRSARKCQPWGKLQMVHGNQAVLRRLDRSKPAQVAPSISSWNDDLQRKCACGGLAEAKCPECKGKCGEGREEGAAAASAPLQAKLAVNEPGDPYEQEANQLVDRVLSMPDPAAPILQRLCPEWAEEGEPTPVLRTPSAAAGHAAAPPIVHEVLRSPGQPLDVSTRAFFERRFAHDFGHGRVHTDTKAAASSRAVQATAYTVGRDIVFADNKYAPTTTAGRRLLAHELPHVVQQVDRTQPSGELSVNHDRAEENEADAVAIDRGRSASAPPLAVTYAFVALAVARQAKAQEFPGFSQDEYVTCGAASLVSALLIWDRERKDPNSPNTLLVAACNTVLVYMDDHKSTLVKGWDGISIKGTTGHGQEIYDDAFGKVKAVRDAANVPKAQITESQYQDLGLALYVLFKNNSSAGLTRYQIGQIQSTLGISATRSEAGNSFDELMDKLAGLQPGQVAQVSWYSRGKTQPNGMAFFTPHAFLVGRFQRGAWFVSDQGSKPPTEIEAADLVLLKAAIRNNTQTRDEGIHTGGLPAQNIGGMQIVSVNPDTGVMILGDRSGVETKARDVIMKPGDFIAEVDASVWHSGDRIVAWDFVARTTSLTDAKTEMNGAGTGSGGVILENPLGLFHVFKTSLVSDTNVTETKIDESDSKGGKVGATQTVLSRLAATAQRLEDRVVFSGVLAMLLLR